MIHDINNFHDTELPDLSLSFKQGACLADDPYQEITLSQDHARIALQSCGQIYATAAVFMMKA